FFFSSRRRHTRSYGDWSSDVCSSDLPIPLHAARVIRDAFHRAISWADDFANGSRDEKSFELHEGSPFLCQEVNGAKRWLRQLARSEERRVGRDGGWWRGGGEAMSGRS